MNRESLIKQLQDVVAKLQAYLTTAPVAQNPAPSATKPPLPSNEPSKPKYLWDTPMQARHSVRLICDENGFTLEQKNTMCATIAVESGFNTKAINRNRNSKGVVVSTDRGICQWNDHYHGHEITNDEALNNPEKAVRLMAFYWKKGEKYRRWWVAYSSGAYRRFL